MAVHGTTDSATSGVAFGDRLAALVEERESQLILGLDPDPAKLWPDAVEAGDRSARERSGTPAAMAAAAVEHHCRSVIDAVGDDCLGVKFQLACFERLGSHGWAALEAAVAAARERGMLVIADGKRGDVPVSAAVYAQSLLGSVATPWGEVPGLGADAATVNPLMGRDSLDPLVEQARSSGRGVFALVRTSNPGAADVEDLAVAGPSTDAGATVSDLLADIVDELGRASVGERGLSAVGAVVGATEPAHIARLRERMPHAVFLIPGVGAQGGRPDDLGDAFAAGPASGLITVSRALVNAADTRGGGPADAARAAAAELRAVIWNVAA